MPLISRSRFPVSRLKDNDIPITTISGKTTPRRRGSPKKCEHIEHLQRSDASGYNHTKLSLLSWVCNVLSTHVSELSNRALHRVKSPTESTYSLPAFPLDNDDLVAAHILKSLSAPVPQCGLYLPQQHPLALLRGLPQQPSQDSTPLFCLQDSHNSASCASMLCCGGKAKLSHFISLWPHTRALLLP